MMKKICKMLYKVCYKAFQTVVSLCCVILFSKFKRIGLNSLRREFIGANERLIILCNGPSMKDSIVHNIDRFMSNHIMVVNNYYNSDLLKSFKPKFHIICDPAYFRKGVVYADNDELNRFVEFLNSLDWEVNLLVPYEFKGCYLHRRIKNKCVKFYYLNLTPVDGFICVRHWIYKNSLGMPLAMNILIPAIFSAINIGFKKIEIYGADYSWPIDIRVNKYNQTCMKDHHFYDDDDKLHVMEGFDMSLLFGNFSKAFKCHKILRQYSESKNVEILNCTPGSFIDAYNRKEGC